MTLHHLCERLFRFHFRVPLWDHHTWQNRIAHWLGHQYARHLRRMAVIYRLLGLTGHAASCEDFIRYWSRTVWGDPGDLFRPVVGLLARGPYRTLVCGHTHMPGLVSVEGRHYVNAGSWTFGAAQHEMWDGRTLAVEDAATGGTIRDEHYRWILAGHDPGDFFEWWRTHYRGWLCFEGPGSK